MTISLSALSVFSILAVNSQLFSIQNRPRSVSVHVCTSDMKRPQKILVGILLFAILFSGLWTLVAPLLFPKRFKAVNASFQTWVAKQPAPAR